MLMFADATYFWPGKRVSVGLSKLCHTIWFRLLRRTRFPVSSMATELTFNCNVVHDKHVIQCEADQ